MRLQITHAFAAVMVLTPLRPAGEILTVQPQSKIWVEGTSTIKSFQCAASDFSLTVSGETNSVTAVLGGQKAVKTVELTVPSEKLDCNNGTMNDHMRKAIKADENPSIHFHLATYDVAKGAEGVQGTLRGTLDLGGTKKQIDVAAVATDAGNGALRVAGTYELSLESFDLKAPKLMFGRIKVGDKVNVRFDLVLKN